MLYLYLFLCRTCRQYSANDVLVYILIPYYMLYLFLCRTCGRHFADDVSVHWDAEEGGPPGVGLQGVPATVRHDIQVQGQGKANQLHLLPGKENAGGAILVMVEKELLVLCMEFMILNSIAHFKYLVSSMNASS